MAKNITEDDLAAGLAGFGDGFSTITEKRPRRDSPFGPVNPEAEAKSEKVVEIRPEKTSSEAPARDTASELDILERARALREAHADRQVPKSADAAREPSPIPQVETSKEVEVRRAPRTIEEAAREVKILLPSEGEGKGSARKADIYSERVTLKLSVEMRDALDALAKELQRRRTSKDERITSNTVMRVAINALLGSLELQPGESVNTEQELLELVKGRVNTPQ